MTAREELSNLALKGKNADFLLDLTANLLETICEEHKFQQKPLWRRALHSHPHYWGSSIFGPILQEAGLITVEKGKYAPTLKGLEIYEGLVQESHLEQSA